MICWTEKSSVVTAKSWTLPSLEPFLVSTLRVFRSKLSLRVSAILMTSPSPMSSSILSMTKPKLEYSRTE